MATDLSIRLSKAKTRLILDHPFVGTIALNMPFVLSETVPSGIPGVELSNPTACTNGKAVYFNPKFIEPLTDEELIFLVAHECLHPMLEHNFRRQARDHMKFNAACDFVINQLLSDEGIGKFIEGGCLDQNIYKRGGGTSEGIYAILPESYSSQSGAQMLGQGGGLFGSGQGNSNPKGQPNGQPYDQVADGGATKQDIQQQAAEWKVRVAQAGQAAKMMGKLSANMQRLIDEVLAPKVDWREVLRRFVEKAKNDSRSWSRPNRRFLPQGIYMPSIAGEMLGEIAFAIDCSGSIGQKEINQFASEIMSVKEEGNPTKIHLVYFDSAVCHYEGFNKDDDVHVEPHGGGGTAFSPVMRYLSDHDIEPVALVFLTDLYCNDYGPVPEYPVLWVSTVDHNGTGYGAPPFGEVVVMKDMEL